MAPRVEIPQVTHSTRVVSTTHADCLGRNYDELLQQMWMVVEDAAQGIHPSAQGHVVHPEEHNAGMGHSIPEYQVTEVLVVRQDRAAFANRYLQDFSIFQSLWEFSPTRDNVMSFIQEKRCQPIGDPFIEKELHRAIGAAATPLSRGTEATSLRANERHALTSSMVSRG